MLFVYIGIGIFFGIPIYLTMGKYFGVWLGDLLYTITCYPWTKTWDLEKEYAEDKNDFYVRILWILGVVYFLFGATFSWIIYLIYLLVWKVVIKLLLVEFLFGIVLSLGLWILVIIVLVGIGLYLLIREWAAWVKWAVTSR